MPARRLVRPMDAIAIDLAGSEIRQKSMPDLMCLLRQSEAMRFLHRVRRREETQLYLRRVFGEQGEVDAAIPAGRAQRCRPARPETQLLRRGEKIRAGRDHIRRLYDRCCADCVQWRALPMLSGVHTIEQQWRIVRLSDLGPT